MLANIDERSLTLQGYVETVLEGLQGVANMLTTKKVYVSKSRTFIINLYIICFSGFEEGYGLDGSCHYKIRFYPGITFDMGDLSFFLLNVEKYEDFISPTVWNTLGMICFEYFDQHNYNQT